MCGGAGLPSSPRGSGVGSENTWTARRMAIPLHCSVSAHDPCPHEHDCMFSVQALPACSRYACLHASTKQADESIEVIPHARLEWLQLAANSPLASGYSVEDMEWATQNVWSWCR